MLPKKINEKLGAALSSLSAFFSILVGELLREASDLGVLLHPNSTHENENVITKSLAGQFASDKVVYPRIDVAHK